MSRRPSTSCTHLQNQVIDERGPGTVLRDFETLLEFMGPTGIRASGKHHLLPLNRLFELDELLANPLRPRLRRPQQQSFPHIHGLYLLLSATQLGVPEGQGKKTGILKPDPAVLAAWQALNATERYFTLLEAWLRHGSWESGGGRATGWMGRDMSLHARDLWRGLPAQGMSFELRAPQDFIFYGVESRCTLALFELFGLFTVQRGAPADGENWRIQEVHHTAFGDELLALVFPEIQREIFDEVADLPAFGAWQPLLQRHFPEWRNNLVLPEPEFREGTFEFKVSLARAWRRIAIPAHANMEELAGAIINAFDFDGDHLYRFELRNRDGTSLAIVRPVERDADVYTDDFEVGYLPLAERSTMLFRYDYGADWEFDVLLEKVGPPDDAVKKATVIKSYGEPPPEYEYEDDEDDDW